MKTEVCNFSGAKIYPGHGKIAVRIDNKSFRLLNGKVESLFWAKKKPTKIRWTVFSRRLFKKGSAEEIAKRKTRKIVKVERAIVGATWDEIVAKKTQPKEVRDATRAASIAAAKEKKKQTAEKKKAEKIKLASAAHRSQQKLKTTQATNKTKRAQARY